MCSLRTNMLSCGFVFVSSGLIAARTVYINIFYVYVQCVSVCGSVQGCRLLLAEMEIVGTEIHRGCQWLYLLCDVSSHQ